MASKYEITPLSSNKTILLILKGIEKYLHDNPLYKVYFTDVAYTSGTQVYDVEDLHIAEGDVLTSGDIVVYNNSYYAIIDAVGETTYTIVDAVSFKGDKGDTGATGATGATGNGIASIEKTSTSGLVDTYTITYTNGSSSTFDVTNGKDGQNGQNGQDGNGIASIEKTSTSGNVDTYTITYTNGNTDTFTITNALIKTEVLKWSGSLSLTRGTDSNIPNFVEEKNKTYHLKYTSSNGMYNFSDYITENNEGNAIALAPIMFNFPNENRLYIGRLSCEENANLSKITLYTSLFYGSGTLDNNVDMPILKEIYEVTND